MSIMCSAEYSSFGERLEIVPVILYVYCLFEDFILHVCVALVFVYSWSLIIISSC